MVTPWVCSVCFGEKLDWHNVHGRPGMLLSTDHKKQLFIPAGTTTCPKGHHKGTCHVASWADANRFARERQRVKTAADQPTDRKAGRGQPVASAEHKRLPAKVAELEKELRNKSTETDGDEDAMDEDVEETPAEEGAADEAKANDLRKKINAHRSLLKQVESMEDEDRFPEDEKQLSGKV